MRKTIFIALISLFSVGLYAQNEGIGLGVILGEPTGLSAKFWTGERTAVDAAVAWSFYAPPRFHIHSNFLFHNFDLFSVGSGELPLYFGGGAYIALTSDFGLGLRAPVGVAYHFEDIPLELFVEVAPGISLLPDTKFYFGGGTGARYYF